jgi:hypothetical protein
MKKLCLFLLLGTVCLLVAMPAHATNLIVNGGFENDTGGKPTYDSVTPLTPNTPANQSDAIFDTSDTGAQQMRGKTNYAPGYSPPADDFYAVGSTEGIWYDRRQWVRVNGVDGFAPDAPTGYSGDHFAYLAWQGGNHTDLLSQGVLVPSGLGAGDEFELSFKYYLEGGSASVYVLGLQSGGYLQGVAAPWQVNYDGSGETDFFTYLAAGENILLNMSLATTSDWVPVPPITFALDKDYDALVLAFRFQVNGDYFQGLDDVYG